MIIQFVEYIPEEIRKKLENGFEVAGQRFRPFVYLQSADEPEYGCEERLEDQVYGCLAGFTLKGMFSVPIEEKDLEKSGLFDEMWLGELETETGVQKVTVADKIDIIQPLVQGPWLAKIAPELYEE